MKKESKDEFPDFARKVRMAGYPELAAKLRTDRPGRIVGPEPWAALGGKRRKSSRSMKGK